MEAVVISGQSKKDFKLLVGIAQRMGLSVKFVKEDDLGVIGMEKAITERAADDLIDNEEFLK